MHVQDLPPYAHMVFKDETSGEYVAECQEIPGLSGIGETEAEAIDELSEAIAGWLEVLKEQELPFPPPFFDVKGDLVAVVAAGPGTTAGSDLIFLQESYPDVRMEQSNQEGRPQTGTSLLTSLES